MMTPATYQTEIVRQNRVHVPRHYDASSLLTEHESRLGLDYDNSHRVFPDAATELKAKQGMLTPDQIASIAPRILNFQA